MGRDASPKAGSVGMIMLFRVMAGMVMVVSAVLAGMVMIMHFGSAAVDMLVEMLMHMLVVMFVGMLVAVGLPVVRMLMAVGVGMVMPVEMFVLVFSFHGKSSFTCS
jgi:hypothetical protein